MDHLAKICPRCGSRFDAAAVFCQKDGAQLRLIDGEGPDPRIGQVLLDQFRIEERIGAGGMGTVYRARQTTLGRDVAIKILNPDLATNSDAIRRFQREARISTSIDHPNVVRVSLFGQLPDGSLYIVMELLRGRTLADLMRNDGPLPVHRALHIAAQVCDGVGEAHAQGVVHRDVKPENVFLVTKGRDHDFVKVLDFGIARVVDPGAEQTSHTATGLVFGTARYISPEGAAGEPTDARSDVYSLGVLTYQLLCGETPFEANTPVTMLMKHIHEPPPHIKSRRHGAQVPDAIADVVMRSLAKNPDARYEDATHFGEVLRGAAARAGLDVRVTRGAVGSIVPSSPGIHAAPSDRRDPSSSHGLDGRVSHVPRTVMMPQHSPSAPPGGNGATGLLSSAPSPFGGQTDELRVPGLRASPRGRGQTSPIATVLIAFVLGAAGVAGGVYLVRALASDPAATELEALGASAREALAQRRFDSPPGDNVRELTDRMIAVRPDDDDTEALRLRSEAASALVDEGDAARTAGRADEARDRYTRALALVAGEPRATAGIAALDAPVAPPREAALRVEPLPLSGEPCTFLAIAPDGVELASTDRPRFVVMRNGRRVGSRIDAGPGHEPGSWSASYTFAQPGTYEVRFVAGDPERVELSLRVEVQRGARAPVQSGWQDPPPITTQGALGPLPDGPIPAIIDAPPPQVASARPEQTASVPGTVGAPPRQDLPPILPLSPQSDSPGTTTRRDPPPQAVEVPALPLPWTSQ